MTGFWGAGLGFGENRGPVGELNVQMFSSATVCMHAHTVSQGIPQAWGRQEEEAICLQGDDMQKTIEKAREPQR